MEIVGSCFVMAVLFCLVVFIIIGICKFISRLFVPRRPDVVVRRSPTVRKAPTQKRQIRKRIVVSKDGQQQVYAVDQYGQVFREK